MSRVQLALNVDDLETAVNFYTKLFVTEPSKRCSGYANFIIANPPLNLVLLESAGSGGTLNHLGVEDDSSNEVTAHRSRLVREGLVVPEEKDASGYYPLEDKFWVTGPSGERWEHNVVLAHRDSCGALFAAPVQREDACCIAVSTDQSVQRNVGPISSVEIRDAVQRGYAAAAVEAREVSRGASSCCGSSTLNACDPTGQAIFGAALYDRVDKDVAPNAVTASLGCGVPTAVADLYPGEVVLDLGSGAGADVLIAAARVAPAGRAIGLDMTPEMLELARHNATAAGVDNVEFLEGYLEDIPLPSGSVDVVISNCVINLVADKHVVLREAARVLRSHGRLAVSDVIADSGMDMETRLDMAAWTGCIGGALTEVEYREALSGAGFNNIEITETHRVHPHAFAAIIRARRATPSSAGANAAIG